MAEKSEARALPANLLRTAPYTAYVAVGSYAVIFGSRRGAWLEAGLLLNEVLNAGLKWALKAVVGKDSQLLRRPRGAADSGIYPQHRPQLSTSSGMPSGHAQTSVFLAVLLSREVLHQHASPCADAGLQGGMPGGAGGEACLALVSAEAPLWSTATVPLCYVWLIALLVIVSRTRLGGPLGLAVRVDGRPVAQHSFLQVVAGGLLGGLLGDAAGNFLDGKAESVWRGFLGVVVVLACILAAAISEVMWGRPLCSCCCESSSGSNSDKVGGSDTERSMELAEFTPKAGSEGGASLGSTGLASSASSSIGEDLESSSGRPPIITVTSRTTLLG